MNQNMNQEVEVEEVYNEEYQNFFGVGCEPSQDYIDFLEELNVTAVAFNHDVIIDENINSPYQKDWWDEPIEINPVEENLSYYDEDFWDELDNNLQVLERVTNKDIVSIQEKVNTIVYQYNYNFPQPEPKYFKVSPFELIPQKKYLTF